MTSSTNNTYQTITEYSMVQTFYADPEAVNKSSEITLTSIDLYFKSKPSTTKNASGKPAPGVSIAICEVQNDSPILEKTIYGSVVRKSYDEIYSFSDASTPTTFGYSSPVKLTTDRFYGVVIIFEDPSFELWQNKQGDRLVGTNIASPGSNVVKDGKLYLRNNSSVYKALSDTDLKFAVNVAKYVSNTYTGTFVNKDYEFFSTTGRTGEFLGGEWVYRDVANSTGSISVVSGESNVIGTGTSFSSLSEGSYVVVYGNNSTRQVYQIAAVTNNTLMSISGVFPFTNTSTSFKSTAVGRVHYKDNVLNKLFLVGSTVNSTSKFIAGDVIRGVDTNANCTISSVDNFSVDRVKLRADVQTPARGTITNRLTTAVWDGTQFVYNTMNGFDININDTSVKNINKWDAYILSRSNEVGNANLYSNAASLISNKSFKVDTTLAVNSSNSNLFEAPDIQDDKLDMFVIQNKISNTFTSVDANGVTIDTEVLGSGLALSRHITTKVTFANNRFAEDVRMYMVAHRPPNTDIRVYARVHNSHDPESFDDKAWTPLEYVENGAKYSSNEDDTDFMEYQLGLPQHSETANVLPGSFTTQLNNTVIVATGVNPSTYVANNNVVKLYNPLIPEDYIIGVVASANSTAITLGSAISNNNLVGSGFVVDRVKYYNIAFNNITNDNVARYYNSSLVEFDTFDSMQIKVVMLSDSTYVVPKIDQIQVIGVSA